MKDPPTRTVADVAQRLRVSPRTVYRFMKDGRLRGERIGRVWRFRDSDIEQMLRGESPTSESTGSVRSQSA